MMQSGDRKNKADDHELQGNPEKRQKMSPHQKEGDNGMPWWEGQQRSFAAADGASIWSDFDPTKPPIGLKLRKSDSLVDLISKTLNGDSNPEKKKDIVVHHIDNEDDEEVMVIIDDDNDDDDGDAKGKGKVSAADSKGSRPLLKASNFPATLLKIGDWKYIPKHRSDLVVKFYYAKQRIVWETTLDQRIKKKIEFCWSDIMDINISFLNNGLSKLEIVLDRKPYFYVEANPEQAKHASWRQTMDFTGGEASAYRRHLIECSAPLLSKNLEKIAQIDPRLYKLSRAPPIVLDSPFFAGCFPVNAYQVLTQDDQEGCFNTSYPSVLGLDGSKAWSLNETWRPQSHLFAMEPSCQNQATSSQQCLVQPSGLVDEVAPRTQHATVEGSSSTNPYFSYSPADQDKLRWLHDLLLGDSPVDVHYDDDALLHQIKALESMIYEDSTAGSRKGGIHPDWRLSQKQSSGLIIAADENDQRARGDQRSDFVSHDESTELLYHLPRTASEPYFLRSEFGDDIYR